MTAKAAKKRQKAAKKWQKAAKKWQILFNFPT